MEPSGAGICAGSGAITKVGIAVSAVLESLSPMFWLGCRKEATMSDQRREGMKYEDGIGPMLKLQEMEADGYEGFSHLMPYELGLLLRDCLAALTADGPVVLHNGKVLTVDAVVPMDDGTTLIELRLSEGGDDE